jgi:WD40 repeat protein
VLLAAGTAGGTVSVWDPDTGDLVWEPVNGAGRVTSVVFGTGAAGMLLLAAGSDEGDEGMVRLWDAENRTPLGQPLIADSRWVHSLALETGAGDRVLLAAATASAVQTWQIVNGTPVGPPQTWDRQGADSVALAAHAGGRTLLASGRHKEIYLWDADGGVASGERLLGHAGTVHSVAFGTEAGGAVLLASGGSDGTVRLWRPGTGAPVHEDLDSASPVFTPYDEDPTRFADKVNSMAFGRGVQGRALLASGIFGGKNVWLWDRDSGAVVDCLPIDIRWISSMAFGHGGNGQALLACSGSEKVWLCEPHPGNPMAPVWKTLVGHEDEVTSVAFGTGAGRRALLASGGSDGTVRLWDPDDATPVGEPLTGHTQVNSVAFGTGTDDRVLLASGGSDDTRKPPLFLTSTIGTVRLWLWDPDVDTPVGRLLTGHEGAVTSVAFGTGPDDRVLLASGDSKGTVRLWDPDDEGRPVREPLTGHEGAVTSVAFGTGAEGRLLLASAGDDRTVRFWDPLTGAQLMLIRRRIPAAALTSDESIFAIGDSEGLTVIDVSGLVIPAEAYQIANPQPLGRRFLVLEKCLRLVSRIFVRRKHLI